MTLPLKPLNTGAECIEFMATHDWYSQTEENTRAIAAKLGLDLTGELTADQCLDIWEEAGKHWTEKPHPSPTANENRQPDWTDESDAEYMTLREITNVFGQELGMTYGQIASYIYSRGIRPQERGRYAYGEIKAALDARRRKLTLMKHSAANAARLRVPAIFKCPHCGGLL